MRLLHVDHDASFVRQFHSELLRNGAVLCDFSVATETQEALDLLETEAYDAILLDPFSWGQESWSACSRLAQAAHPRPVVVLTASGEDTLALQAIESGAHDYLLKNDVPAGWLMRRIRYAIERTKYQVAHRGSQRPPQRQLQEVAVSTSSAGGAPGRLRNVRTPHGMRYARPETAPIAYGDGNALRVLHAEDDPAFASLMARLIEKATKTRFELKNVDTLSDTIQTLEHRPWDAILLDLSLPDSQGLPTLTTVLSHAPSTPVLVLTGRDDDLTAIEGMQSGAEDYLIKEEPNLRYAARALQLAVARRKSPARVNTRPPDKPAAASVTAESKIVSERRRHPRYLLTKPIFAIPVQPDRSPAEAHGADGFSVDLGRGGLKFEVLGLDRLPTKHLLVGIEASDSVLYFATVEARQTHAVPRGLSIGAEFATGDRDLLRRENLEPTFQADTCRFETCLPVDTLARWVELGIFRPVIMDCVTVCPRCRGVVTVRNGCRVCGSVRLHSRPLLHHFACAHVGYVSDFEEHGAIVCPKCRTRNLVVGADYEHLSGPYSCLDCGWSDTELDQVAQCLRCAFRFPLHQSNEEDLIGYHVNRLDPLALINDG